MILNKKNDDFLHKLLMNDSNINSLNKKKKKKQNRHKSLENSLLRNKNIMIKDGINISNNNNNNNNNNNFNGKYKKNY